MSFDQSDEQPLEIEVRQVGRANDEAAEPASEILEHRGISRVSTPVLAAIGVAVVGLVGVLGWQSQRDIEPEGIAIPEATVAPDPELPVLDPREIASAVDDRSPLDLKKTNPTPSWPLFDEGTDLVLAFSTKWGGIRFVDAATGDTLAERRQPDRTSRSTLPGESEWPTIGRIGGTLVMKDGPSVVGFRLDDAAWITYGEADEVILTEGLVILTSRPPEGNGAAVVSALTPDGTNVGNVLEPAFRQRSIDPTGYYVGPDGSFVFTGESFEKQTEYAIVASGPNHLLEARCNPMWSCNFHRTDLATWVAEPVEVGASFNYLGSGISPDGQWLSTFATEPRESANSAGGKKPYSDIRHRLINLETGNYLQISSTRSQEDMAGLGPAVWDPTSRYAVIAQSPGLLVIDVLHQEVRIIDAGPSPSNSGFSDHVVIFERSLLDRQLLDR